MRHGFYRGGGNVIARLVCDNDQLSGDVTSPSQWSALEVQRKARSLESRFSRVFSGDVFVEATVALGLQVAPGNSKAVFPRTALWAKAQYAVLRPQRIGEGPRPCVT